VPTGILADDVRTLPPRRGGLDALELTGRTHGHVRHDDELGCLLHPAAAAPLRAMREAAARDGIELGVVSAFRDFERQRMLWNAKYLGERPLLDAQGRKLDPAVLDPRARIEAILLWTALPGASRHHWGTDVDVFDRAAVPASYRLRLEADEYAPGGVFERLSAWLDRHMRRFGFYRPYATGAGGVRPEPWHLSYAPVSRTATRALDAGILEAALRGSGVQGEREILAGLRSLHERYVRTVDRPPRMRSRWARPAG